MQRQTHIQLGELVTQRKAEMKLMVDLIKKQENSGKRTFQRLPRWQRRRAMSWNLHLLPKHMRRWAEKETLPARIKHRKRRKVKRKKTVLKKTPRLKTHMFHCKRMHMGEKYGHLLPLESCSHIWRTSYRFQKTRTTLYDASWYQCLEFTARTKAEIMDLLKSSVLGSLDSGMWFSGKREGSIDLQNKGFIGPAKFMWKQANDQEQAQLWLWIHPLMMKEIPTWESKTVKMKVRSDLTRFELRGPKSMGILSSSLMITKTTRPEALKSWTIAGKMIPDSLPKGMVLVVNVNEPLKEMIKIPLDETGIASTDRLFLNIPDGIASTDLWTNSKSTDVILVQQSFPKFGSGWDLICNSDLGVHLFALMAKQKGLLTLPLKERNLLYLHNHLGVYPNDYPDTIGHGKEAIVPISRYPQQKGMIPVTVLLKWAGVPRIGSFIYKFTNISINPVKYDEKLEKIGFITTATYSLEDGMGIGIGFIQNTMKIPKSRDKPHCLICYNSKELYMYPALLEIRL